MGRVGFSWSHSPSPAAIRAKSTHCSIWISQGHKAFSSQPFEVSNSLLSSDLTLLLHPSGLLLFSNSLLRLSLSVPISSQALSLVLTPPLFGSIAVARRRSRPSPIASLWVLFDLGFCDILGATELKGPVNYRYKDLKSATKNFSDENKLGEGGFGDVYKGTLKNGKVVAVKKLLLGPSSKTDEHFESEVKLISNVHHRNLVRLLVINS
ncbi:hypothetical protein RIF29_30828 [Crotalaria pallida]|uniref:Protein kinase domain-containing protein n=1 Tax=Crotalaria pallida TaxID=3830 RepID=A0AAN9EIY1_CROPI